MLLRIKSGRLRMQPTAHNRSISNMIQGHWNIFLSEGAVDEWQAPIGCNSGDQKQSPLKLIQLYLLDSIYYILYDTIK